jgi:hypothetical protein
MFEILEIALRVGFGLKFEIWSCWRSAEWELPLPGVSLTPFGL